MAKAQLTALTVISGGDEYLNERAQKTFKKSAMLLNPEAEVIELDAGLVDAYEFEEAVSPSLLASASIVMIPNVEEATESLSESLKNFAERNSGVVVDTDTSMVIAAHNGSMKGKKLIEMLKKAGAHIEPVKKLASDRDRMAFVRQEFRAYGRSVAEPAVQQLVAVLGARTAELAAMCQQLCFDFDENPLSLATAMRYLDDAPEATGFEVADAALEGKSAEAVVKLRRAIKRGVEPLALIGAIASKLRSMGKAAAIQAGKANAAQLKMNGWFLTRATQQVRGWSSEGLGICIEALAHADQEAKSSSGDPMFALEQAVELIARRGRPLVA